MEKLQTRKYKHTQILIYSLLGIGPLSIIGQLLDVQLSPFILFFNILLIQAIAFLCYRSPKTMLLLLPITIIINLYISKDYWTNLRNYLQGYDLLEPLHAGYTLYFFGIIFSLFTLYIVNKSKYTSPYFITILVYMIHSWYTYIDAAYLYLVLFTSAYLSLLALKQFDQLHKTHKIDFSLWTSVCRKYIIIIITLSFLMPKADAFIRWSSIEDALIHTFPSLAHLRQDVKTSRGFTRATVFDFSETGFMNSPNQLGGPVELNHDIAFEVIAPFPLYLRGNVLTNYTGQGWQHNNRDKRTYETGAILSTELKRGQEIEINIKQKNLVSFTLFAPYQVKKISAEGSKKIWLDLNRQITLLGARYRDESYKITAIIPEKSEHAAIASPSILFYKDDYLTLPDTLPKRVKDLARYISADGNNAYDKALLIQDFLRQNYTYDLKVDHIPAGQDFVDHFLFEQKRGYCTYFATSLAVLLRSIDIPTRYVEGFVMPAELNQGHYDVAFSNGHAWVEAYFDGYGWITLEGTPSFTPPSPARNTIALGANDNIDLYSMENERDYMMALKNIDRVPVDIQTQNSSQVSSKQSFLYLMLKKLIWGISLLIPLTIISRCLFIRYKNKLYRDYLHNNPHRVIYLYHNITELYDHLGHSRFTGETEKEYARRIKKRIYDQTHDFEFITSLYLAHKYGQNKNTDTIYETLLDFFHYVEYRVQYKLGWYQFFYRKYLLGSLYTRF